MKQNLYCQNSPKFKAEIVEIEIELISLSHLYMTTYSWHFDIKCRVIIVLHYVLNPLFVE